jgi:nicotinic acid mononucleotide adenylyltransferase
MKRRIFVVSTGAGAGAQQRLWRTPGCSATFAGAAFPYAPDQTNELLGFEPEQYCCEASAVDLATAAYYRAWIPGSEAVGIGLTASVASVRPHRGEHRIHAAVMTADGVWLRSSSLPKGAGAEDRARDGALADDLIMSLIERPEGENVTALARERFFARPYFADTGVRSAWTPRFHRVLFPGTFNPPHAGHLEPAERLRATFHVTADPPHKPRLSVAQLVERAKVLHGKPRLFSEGDALYIDKARRNPGASFLMGADALERLLDPKWGPEPIAMLYEIAELGCRFLVVDRGRWTLSGVLDRAQVPNELRYAGRLFVPVPGRWDSSSSALRAGD